MHGSVREELEYLLAKPSDTAAMAAAHISECSGCASELGVMRQQSEMLKILRPPAELEPPAGFYARVLQRIEERAKHSIWWVFVYKPIGKRLAYASLAVAVALGSYVVAAESSDGHLGSPFAGAEQEAHYAATVHYDAPVMGDADQQRQAVLANFVSHPSAAE